MTSLATPRSSPFLAISWLAHSKGSRVHVGALCTQGHTSWLKPTRILCSGSRTPGIVAELGSRCPSSAMPSMSLRMLGSASELEGPHHNFAGHAEARRHRRLGDHRRPLCREGLPRSRGPHQIARRHLATLRRGLRWHRAGGKIIGSSESRTSPTTGMHSAQGARCCIASECLCVCVCTIVVHDFSSRRRLYVAHISQMSVGAAREHRVASRTSIRNVRVMATGRRCRRQALHRRAGEGTIKK